MLTSATEVFAKRGYQASTVDNIVAAAKIGVGSFYAQFDGKEDCLLATYERIVGEARGQVAAAVPAEAPWSQKALAALHELVTLIATEPLGARVALVEIQTGGPAALARYQETLDFAIASLRGGRAAIEGEPDPPEMLEESTACGLAWLLAQRALRGEIQDGEKLFVELAEIVLDPYLGAAKTRREITAFQKSLAPA
jgi:AcrR family transcriptional regulator